MSKKKRRQNVSTAEVGVGNMNSTTSKVNSPGQNEERVTLQESYERIKNDLRELAARIQQDLKEMVQREGALAKRELDVTEREQKVASGVADTEAQLRFQKEKAMLEKREQEIVSAELKRDAGYAEERVALDKELQGKRMKVEAEIAGTRNMQLSVIEAEIDALRKERMAEVVKAEQAERGRIRMEIASEQKAWKAEKDAARIEIETERGEHEKQKGALYALQSELERRKAELEANERDLERKEQRLELQWQKKNAEVEDAVEVRLEEERKSMVAIEQTLKNENARLRDAVRIQTGLVGAFDELKRQLDGKDPAEVVRDINSKVDEISRLREELATRPTEEMRERYGQIEAESQRQKARIDELEREANRNSATIAETESLRRKNSELADENKMLANRASIFEGAVNDAQAELKRLRAAYQREEDREARIHDVEAPYIQSVPSFHEEPDEIDEVQWLQGIGQSCINYGLRFHPRILAAFHTALKTAEWSPLAVLAGVSGTGKSELPRLYAHFGGMLFLPLAVQPNWDSQEAMLGFFNSIDNKYDAQPVLRFLAQTQKKSGEGYPGLQDAMSLILLDEMNLAHAELYFAEFLSKLELRRGMKGSVPMLDVKLGSGITPYSLPLGRNVLWAGTMNQDETTKSLSDKVLDRSIVIHFPRPTNLERRKELKPLPQAAPLLPRKVWERWWLRDTGFTDEQVQPFKSFIEMMNAALSQVGRALGHRVWQSIEYYMANYPTVRTARGEGGTALRDAMAVAFEDQLVQKVMPKLRGIETRGRSKTECLDKIRAQLVEGGYSIIYDFDLACEFGYGQFIWQSANYLRDAAPADPDVVPDTGAPKKAK